MKNNLKPYQVGECDIVLAENPNNAMELLRAHTGCFEDDELDVVDLSDNLDMKFYDEEFKFMCTLGEWIKDMDKPQYVVGWE